MKVKLKSYREFMEYMNGTTSPVGFIYDNANKRKLVREEEYSRIENTVVDIYRAYDSDFVINNTQTVIYPEMIKHVIQF